MTELNELIKAIYLKYNYIDANWKKSVYYQPLNMKKKRVEDVYKDESLLLYVLDYRKFINDNISDVVNSIQKLCFVCIVNCNGRPKCFTIFIIAI